MINVEYVILLIFFSIHKAVFCLHLAAIDLLESVINKNRCFEFSVHFSIIGCVIKDS